MWCAMVQTVSNVISVPTTYNACGVQTVSNVISVPTTYNACCVRGSSRSEVYLVHSA